MEVECRILLSLKANKPHFTTIMAELNLYVCKNCGWSIEAPCDGIDFLMNGGLAYFFCQDCKHVFGYSFEFCNENTIYSKCPKCGGHNTVNWKPGLVCPKCGGILEDKGLSCLMD